MIYPVYCVRDTLTGYDANFMPAMNEESALRMFEYSVNQPGLTNFRPADYDFYQVAEFDTQSGRMTPVDPPKFIVNGASVKHEK